MIDFSIAVEVSASERSELQLQPRSRMTISFLLLLVKCIIPLSPSIVPSGTPIKNWLPYPQMMA